MGVVSVVNSYPSWLLWILQSVGATLTAIDDYMSDNQFHVVHKIGCYLQEQ